MSLVERALKKLQESRGLPATPAQQSTAPATVLSDAAAVAHEVVALEHRAQAATPPRSEPPHKVVNIDKDALRSMELLPPPEAERWMASQFQRIKRPLVAAALGKSANPVHNGHLIMLVSALPGEGKTFTSLNLALSTALERDVNVLLVDADIPKPHVTRIFGLQGERGLLDLLADGDLHPESVILRTSVPGLSLLPAGRRLDNATELLASERMEQVAMQLGANGSKRIVIFDSSPLLLSTESRALIPVMGQVVLVVRAEITLQKAVMEALDIIGDAKPVSLILNQSHEPVSGAYYGYGSYGDVQPAAAAETS
jgi:protein-tyrosine kinase